MYSDSRVALINVCKEIVEDGILTKSEIVGLVKWINANPQVRKSWPGKPLVKLLKSVFADNKISKEESRKVGEALQSILRTWAKQESTAPVLPTITVEVVDAYDSVDDRDAPPPGDWQHDPATERQTSFASSLGINLPKNATKGYASDQISKALQRQGSGEATSSQRDYAKRFGVTIPRQASYGEAKAIIRNVQPTWDQKQFYERAGLAFPDSASREAIKKEIKQLMRDSGISKKVQDSILAEEKADVAAEQEMRQEDIERYGLEVVEDFERWEKLADDIGPYVVIYRSGKSLKVEVVEFDGAEIEEKARGKSRVVLECLFPKRIREDGEKWLEWEKEKQLIAGKIEYIGLLEKVWGRCNIEEIDEYESLKSDFERRAEQLVLGSNPK